MRRECGHSFCAVAQFCFGDGLLGRRQVFSVETKEDATRLLLGDKVHQAFTGCVVLFGRGTPC